ncbi:MAG: CaiB/BaiF CoA transferase family protein [Burkholderiales bacterium]
MPGPLEGVRVLDLTTVVMGPFATQILAELGAGVIKVESHEGDNMRDVSPMRSAHMGHLFMNLNRGKRAIVLDLKKPGGREVILRLLPKTDVLIYNVRPSAMGRLGLSYDDVRAVNPKIIYVGAYGYSQRGPKAGQAAYDDLIQGATGLPAISMQEGGEPRYAPLNLADRVTGLHAVYAVTAALFYRERSGKGQSVEVPMFESFSHFVLGDHIAGMGYEPPIGATGYTRLRHRRPYATQDGYLCALVYNNKQWKSFLGAINRLEVLEDPRFSNHAVRANHIAEVYGFLAEIFKTKTTAQWISILEKADVPVSPMNRVEDVITDPHHAATGFFSIEDHPTEGKIRTMRTPTGWSESPPPAVGYVPRLGEHSAQVLAELGYSEGDIRELARSGVTVCAA